MFILLEGDNMTNLSEVSSVKNEDTSSNNESQIQNNSKQSSLCKYNLLPDSSFLPNSPPIYMSQENSDLGDNTQQRNIIVDILPSFQFYNDLHRHIPNDASSGQFYSLPTYEECQSTSFNNVYNGNNRTLMIQNNGTRSSNIISRIPFIDTQDLFSHHINFRAVNMTAESIQDELTDSQKFKIEQLYHLPKVITPISIDIRLTKTPAKFNEISEEESILKEHTSGDVIYGYIIIENKSSQMLKFEMIYVTLEGYSLVVDHEYQDKKIKRFLRMVDLSASWSDSMVDVSSGCNFIPGDIDYDNCVLGLNNTRILEPGVRYKKFFMFKLPIQLLDVSCKHDQFLHSLLPPSFGVDKYKSSNKYASIEINPVLGYGHCGTKDSPVLTNDLSGDLVSINYSVATRIVGKDSKSNKLTIMKEKEYNLRFIPFGFSQTVTDDHDSISQLDNFFKLIQERLMILENIFRNLNEDKMISSDIYIRDLDESNNNDHSLIIDTSEQLLMLKSQQSYRNQSRNNCDSILSSNSSLSDNRGIVESTFRYIFIKKTIPSIKVNKKFFGGFSKITNSFTNSNVPSNIGIIILSSKIPIKGFSYIQPSLLKKANALETKSKHDQENWTKMIELVSNEEKNCLNHVTIDLKCIQSNNSSYHKPPEIQEVTTELIVITATSTNSIPVKLDTKFLIDEKKLNAVKIKCEEYQNKIREYEQQFKENFDKINDSYNSSINPLNRQELKFTNFISHRLIKDLKSISRLKVEIKNLSVFKRQSYIYSKEFNSLPTNALNTNRDTDSISYTNTNNKPYLSRTVIKEPIENQLTNEWIKVSDAEYHYKLNVDIYLNQDLKETLVPNFQSCLCTRTYCIRINIKFQNNLGIASIDIPVCIRKLEI